jgi:AAA+ ATPase superfamily predicted ATPase
MKNPFSFSGIVEGPAFCNREKEQTDLAKFIENSQNVLLYSHRRFGKTSLINRIFKDFKGIVTIYIDLYGTTSIEDFITALFKGISSKILLPHCSKGSVR